MSAATTRSITLPKTIVIDTCHRILPTTDLVVRMTTCVAYTKLKKIIGINANLQVCSWQDSMKRLFENGNDSPFPCRWDFTS